MSGTVAAITLNPSIDKTITVKKLVPYGLNRVKSARLDPGGKGINVARVLKNFGAKVVVSGLVAGEQGRLLTNFIREEGIEYDFLQTNGETRTNLKIVDENVNRTTEINEAGCFIGADTLTDFKSKFESLMGRVDIAVLSGSLPPGVPDDFYAQCIGIAKAHGVKTLLDADGNVLAQGLKAIPYAVKPNLHELEMLIGGKCGSRQEIVQAARKLLDTGISIVIVSMGPDGAIVAGSSEVYKVSSWDIPVKSTVGAGDSMVGSLAYAILRSESLFDIAKITTAAGTVTASKEGTGVCTLKEVMDSLDNVAVQKIQTF